MRGVSGETCAVFGAVKDACFVSFSGGYKSGFGRTYKSWSYSLLLVLCFNLKVFLDL